MNKKNALFVCLRQQQSFVVKLNIVSCKMNTQDIVFLPPN